MPSVVQVPSVTAFSTRAISYYWKAEFIILAVRNFFRFLMIPAGLLFETNIEGVSVGVAMEEKKFCPAGTSGGLIKWRHLLTTCRVAIKKMVTEYTWWKLRGREILNHKTKFLGTFVLFITKPLLSKHLNFPPSQFLLVILFGKKDLQLKSSTDC